jgi:transcriptional regulator with XRE-family HTH domain
MAAVLHKLLNEIVGNIPGAELAKRLKKSPSYVSQMRSGAQIPTPETLAALAHAFGAVSRLRELLVAALHDEIEQLSFKDASQSPLKESLLDAIEQLIRIVGPSTTPAVRTLGRSFADFPNSFYPLAAVTGDKREDRENKISVGDLGVYAATPGDTRWILNLGLRPDVIKHIDKNFVLLSEAELIKEFAEVNLLVVGSPASNHLARIINSSAVFRFNYSPDVENAIDEIITKAGSLSTAQLVGYREQERNRLVAKMRSLFVGGIFDPTHPDADYVAAQYAQLAMNMQLDFGVLTFAANPYYVLKCKQEGRACDHKYVSIMAAGIHHPATAHALRLLGQHCRREGVFDRHPYGGVIRVELDLNVPFSTRTMKASCRWEDMADKERKPADDQKKLLIDQLKVIGEKLGRRELKSLALTEAQAAECRKLIESL